MDPKGYERIYNRNNHICGQISCDMSSINGRHPVARIFIPLHYTSLHFTLVTIIAFFFNIYCSLGSCH